MKDFLDKHQLKVTGNLKGKKIYIDPGHGGDDPGAVANGFIERDINLVMSFALAKFLKYLGADIKMSRNNNATNKSINARAKEALAWYSDLLISVHNNAGGGDGFEAIHTIFKDHSIGDEVAESIADAVEEYTDQNVRRIFSKENSSGRDWLGINRLSGSIPSVTTEGAFLDTLKDMEVIDTNEEQIEFGYVIGVGIAKYFGVIEKVEKLEIPQNNEMLEGINEIMSGLGKIKKILE